MDKRDKWLIDFQVRNGRKPSKQEILAAAQEGYIIAPLATETAVTASGWRSKLGFGKGRFSWFLLLEFFLLVLIAVFGYVVGYLLL